MVSGGDEVGISVSERQPTISFALALVRLHVSPLVLPLSDLCLCPVHSSLCICIWLAVPRTSNRLLSPVSYEPVLSVSGSVVRIPSASPYFPSPIFQYQAAFPRLCFISYNRYYIQVPATLATCQRY